MKPPSPLATQRSGANAMQMIRQHDELLIDDGTGPDLAAALGSRWQVISDRVMGGLSEASLVREVHLGRPCLCLGGDVRLENGGGFVQMALDLEATGGCIDGRPYAGLRLVAQGNGEPYSVHLRTPDLHRPWESYRASFETRQKWHEHRLPFDRFVPHRTDVPLDLARLRRIGLVAIGRAFTAELRVAEIALYR